MAVGTLQADYVMKNMEQNDNINQLLLDFETTLTELQIQNDEAHNNSLCNTQSKTNKKQFSTAFRDGE